MSTVDPHREAHRLSTELGYGARRIASELGVSRYAAEQLLKRPLSRPVADTVRPVAEPVGRPDTRAADAVADEEPVRLGVDLSRRPRLLANLTGLLELGLKAPVVIDLAVGAFTAAYRHALARGELRAGEAFEVAAHVRPAADARRAA